MDSTEFDRQLRLLGMHGPMGELRLANGKFVIVYKMPDGTHKHLLPPDTMTPDQRAETIKELRRFLRVAEQ